MCKVRVVSGDVVKTQPCDYPLSEAEKAQGYVLLCAHTAASSELTLELLEAGGPQDIPVQSIVTQVRAVRELAPDTRLVRLQTPRTHRLRFLAGQSVTLGWADPALDDVSATYPVASCPCDDRNLHFYIARDDAGGWAQQVSGRIQPGAAVTVTGPTGDFVLADGHRALVFAACDTAFAPVKSLVEHALALDASPSLTLFWLATRSDGHFAQNQCRAWSQALDQFDYELVANADVVAGACHISEAMRATCSTSIAISTSAGPEVFVRTLHEGLRAPPVCRQPRYLPRSWRPGNRVARHDVHRGREPLRQCIASVGFRPVAGIRNSACAVSAGGAAKACGARSRRFSGAP